MSNEMYHTKVLILGSGPAGLCAAIYAARAGLNPILIHGMEPGGQMTITTDVENYPGFSDIIQGPWLMRQMQTQAEKVGTQMFQDIITSIDLGCYPFVCQGDTENSYTGDSLILATGAQARWLGLDSETKFKGFGVSACATCDGFFYRSKTVAVIGGGNTAVEEALFLTQHANKVILVHRRSTLRAEKILQDRLFDNSKIDVIWDHAVEEIIGTDDPPSVTGLRIRHVTTEALQEIELDGVFIAIGHDPTTTLFRGKLAMDDEGYIATANDSTQTSVPGVFAAGDVQDKVFRQAVTAAGTGCMAALEAAKFIAEHPNK